MSWAAIVSGKARHTSSNPPTPLGTISTTATVTINPHIPNISQSTSTHSHNPNCNSRSPSPILHNNVNHDENSSLPSSSSSPSVSSSSSSSTHSNNSPLQNQEPQQEEQAEPQQYQQRNRSQHKHKNYKKQQQQSPQKQSQNQNIYNQSMWNDPRTVASYRLWTDHISNFMAQSVTFYHVFVTNPQFRQSVFDAGLTFHPDTDPANPVLINLNSSRFGMAERISALSPPARIDIRSSSKPAFASAPPTPTGTSQRMSPLTSEPSQTPQSPAFLTSNLINLFDAVKFTNGSVQKSDHCDPHIFAVPNSAIDDSVVHRFMEATRLDVSDTESERLSEGDLNPVNAIKPQTPRSVESSRPVPAVVRRRNGRSRVVSRVLDIRIPSTPICKDQSDKAKVEFIEQISEIFPRITPPKEHADVRADLLARLRNIISDEWKGAGIDVYGSAGNGLGLRSADVDMSLFMPDEVAAAKGRVQGKPDPPKEILARLATIMEENKMVVLSKLLGARVPVIKLQDPVSKLQVDVCVNNTLAVRNTQLLKAYVDLDERFRYVCVLVKLWAKKRELNDTYHGTLSSYAYTLLVIHYLQVAEPPILPCLQRMVNGELVSSDEDLPTEMTDNGDNKLYNTYFDRTVTPETYKSANTQPVHELLMGFFKYYAYTFKYRTDLASIRLGVKTPRSARGWDESAVYAEWEAKQAQYKAQLEAARAALDARIKADVGERRSRANGGERSETGTGVSPKRERIQFPRRPRLASKHLFCIEDPFDIDHDLSRGMEKAAVTVIRQEMMRAYELIAETGDYELVCEEYR